MAASFAFYFRVHNSAPRLQPLSRDAVCLANADTRGETPPTSAFCPLTCEALCLLTCDSGILLGHVPVALPRCLSRAGPPALRGVQRSRPRPPCHRNLLGRRWP